MAHVIVEIDGIRHKLVKTKCSDVCETCSIQGACNVVISTPCMKMKEHFILERRKKK
jgi:hypothetical protein